MNQCLGRQGRKKNQSGRAAQRKKEFKKNEKSLTNILENMKHNNIHIMGIPEGEESEQGVENFFEETMTENSLIL